MHQVLVRLSARQRLKLMFSPSSFSLVNSSYDSPYVFQSDGYGCKQSNSLVE